MGCRRQGRQDVNSVSLKAFFFIVGKYTEQKIFHLNNFQVHSSAAVSTLTLLFDQRHHPSPGCLHCL